MKTIYIYKCGEAQSVRTSIRSKLRLLGFKQVMSPYHLYGIPFDCICVDMGNRSNYGAHFSDLEFKLDEDVVICRTEKELFKAIEKGEVE